MYEDFAELITARLSEVEPYDPPRPPSGVRSPGAARFRPAARVVSAPADVRTRALVLALDRVEAGPRLSAALAMVDRRALNGHDLGLVLTARGGANQLGLALDVFERLPAVGEALLAGRLDVPRARAIFDETVHLAEDVAREVVAQVLTPVQLAPPGVPECFASPGDALSAGRLRAKLHRLVIAVDADAARRRLRAGVDGRRVDLLRDFDGTATLSGTGLRPELAVAGFERVDALARAARQGGDPRTLDQLRADLLCNLLNGDHIDSPPIGRQGVIELTVPLATLAGLSEQPGELAGFGPVTAEIARQIAGRERVGAQKTQTAGVQGVDSTILAVDRPSQWRYSVVDDHGGVIEHGRIPSRALRERVVARDRTCRAPGCNVPASRCDLDHTIDYAAGGKTSAANLGALCRHHHRLKHESSWQLQQPTPGQFTWTSPHGHQHHVTPDQIETPTHKSKKDLVTAGGRHPP